LSLLHLPVPVAHAALARGGLVEARDERGNAQFRKQKLSSVTRREINPNNAAIVFEFDQHSEAELLRDFPWLQRIGVFGFGNRRLAGSELVAESAPQTHRNRHLEPNAVSIVRVSGDREHGFQRIVSKHFAGS
jgi:hypothetical protein